MDFDYAHYMVTGGKVIKENSAPSSPYKQYYRRQLIEVFNMNRTRILAFKNKSPTVEEIGQQPFSPIRQVESVKQMRHIPQVSLSFFFSDLVMETSTYRDSNGFLISFLIFLLFFFYRNLKRLWMLLTSLMTFI